MLRRDFSLNDVLDLIDPIFSTITLQIMWVMYVSELRQTLVRIFRVLLCWGMLEGQCVALLRWFLFLLLWQNTWQMLPKEGRAYYNLCFEVTINHSRKAIADGAWVSRAHCIFSLEAGRDECWSHPCPFFPLFAIQDPGPWSNTAHI